MKFLEAALAINKGGAVFDEMGLGKTIQAEGVLFFHPELWPCLWIVKSGLKFQTATSIRDWMGVAHVPQIINSSKDNIIPGLKHYIVGYDMLVPKVRKLKSGKEVKSGFDITKFDGIIKCVILDECQQIKNVDSTRTQMVRKIVRDKKVIPLSGTPWNNRGSELFPVLNMMDPIRFHSEEGFKRRWVDTYWNGNRLCEGGIRNIPAFREHTKDLCIRRQRTEVMPELPLVNRTKLYIKMDLETEQTYDEAVEEFVQWYQNQAGEISGMALIAAMQKMRHLAAVAKMPSTMEYIDEFVEETDRKLLVFAHHKDVQDLLYMECQERYKDQMPVLKITADMNPQKRFEVQTHFNESKRAMIVASHLAAGEGLNLQTGSDLLIHERQWNPGKEEQAEGRVLRIGQQATSINAVYAHLEGLTAIDSTMDAIVERKRKQFHAAHNNGDMEQWSEQSFAKELAESIIRGYHQKKSRKTA
jgi:SWI/SNF-related matrix-associated actin-dependent regulator 1 of chromatin subfamily A